MQEPSLAANGHVPNDLVVIAYGKHQQQNIRQCYSVIKIKEKMPKKETCDSCDTFITLQDYNFLFLELKQGEMSKKTSEHTL